MQRIEAFSMAEDVLPALKDMCDADPLFEHARTLHLCPGSKDVLDWCSFLLQRTPRVKSLRLTDNLYSAEGSRLEPELMTYVFGHMQPFAKCTPLALKSVQLRRIRLRDASATYCKVIQFCTVSKLSIHNCCHAKALLVELTNSSLLPQKLEFFEFKQAFELLDDELSALDHFLCSISGIKVLRVDLLEASGLPDAAGICCHGRSLRQLSVHARRPLHLGGLSPEIIYDFASFQNIVNACVLLEQLSVALPQCGVLRPYESGDFAYHGCVMVRGGA